MPIPPFEDRPGYPCRVLPEGAHPCDEQEFRARFVEEFPGSRTRQEIAGAFQRMRAAASARGISAIQWVDGSFVETRLDPRDVDVVTFVHASALDRAGEAERLLRGEDAPTGGHVDGWVIAFPSVLYDALRDLFRDQFGHTYLKEDPGAPRHPKGWVSLTLGDTSALPDPTAEGGRT
jgi:hypothetical protein